MTFLDSSFFKKYLLPGISRTKTKVKFSELADQYLEDYAKVNNLAWKRVQSCLKQLTGFFGKQYLQSITPWLIEKYKQKRLSEGDLPPQYPFRCYQRAWRNISAKKTSQSCECAEPFPIPSSCLVISINIQEKHKCLWT